MSDIKAGDEVVLKSGGVAMTVAWVEDENALCVWQDKANHKEQVYPVVVLKKYEPPMMSFETI
ncbi:DUF2158 domain-containing protein [Variovorax sp. PvP013]|uniref:DUF2158 domain-containing protein n=1 Tax=Variovorax sp. PvP013 TaxID=3156435 RepID=UPI003D232719